MVILEDENRKTFPHPKRNPAPFIPRCYFFPGFSHSLAFKCCNPIPSTSRMEGVLPARWGDKWSLKTAKSDRFIISYIARMEYCRKQRALLESPLKLNLNADLGPDSFARRKVRGPLFSVILQGMSAAERVRGDDWSLLCSSNFSDFCPAATGLAIQHP